VINYWGVKFSSSLRPSSLSLASCKFAAPIASITSTLPEAGSACDDDKGFLVAFIEALPLGLDKVDLPSGAAVWTLKCVREEQALFPGLDSNKLYVRSCYPVLFEKLFFDQWATVKKHSNNIILGIPGIGKSSFGLYVFCRLWESGRPVIYSYDKCFGAGTLLAE
jgi:hypothetical protein